MDEWLNKLWCIHTMKILFTNLKKSIHTITWMNLQRITMSNKLKTLHTMWFHLHKILAKTKIEIEKQGSDCQRSRGVGKELNVAMKQQCEVSLWWWKCSVSDTINVSILVVILHYVVLQDFTIGRNWEKVHGMCIIFYNYMGIYSYSKINKKFD